MTSLGSQVPYKTPAPHATHGQESAPLPETRCRTGIIRKASSCRGPFLPATSPFPAPPGSLRASPHPVPAAGAFGTPAPALHSRRGRPSSERRANGAARPRPGPGPHPALTAPPGPRVPRPQTLSTGTRRGAPTWGQVAFEGCPDTEAALPKGTAVSASCEGFVRESAGDAPRGAGSGQASLAGRLVCSAADPSPACSSLAQSRGIIAQHSVRPSSFVPVRTR